MSRRLLPLLCAVLFIWQPIRVAGELARTVPSIEMRGAGAVIELVAHAAVAATSVAAAWALWIENPIGQALAKLALIGCALVGVQSLYWSALPTDTFPSDRLPLAIVTISHSVAWLWYVRRLQWR
jgi:hypothetical protein